MANYSVSSSKHETLTATEVDTVTITGTAGYITVVNRGAGTPAPIYFTVGDNPATPTVAGNNTFVVLNLDKTVVKFDGTNTKVALISAEDVAYSVIATSGI
jgi:hypothetical protein